MRNIVLQVLTAPSCVRCDEFISFWKSVAHEWKHVTMEEISLLSDEGQHMALRYRVLASPGVIADQELIASGGFEKNKVLARLQELSLS